MSQAYSRTPSQLYEVRGAAGFFFDKALSLFGRWVEGEVERASQDAISPGFARSAQLRTFAKCMGDDMSTSSAGFSDPFADGQGVPSEANEQVIMDGY